MMFQMLMHSIACLLNLIRSSQIAPSTQYTCTHAHRTIYIPMSAHTLAIAAAAAAIE